MPRLHFFGLALGALLGAQAFAADFTIAAVGAFGEPLADCRVDSFRLLVAPPGPQSEYQDRFHGLFASDLPDGEYDADIRCRDARLGGRVTVSEIDRFAVVREYRRMMRSDHIIPQLVIRINGSRPPEETWWVTLHSLYAERTDTAKFQGDTGEAYVADPDPGSYLVSVLSTGGYDCLREIDLVEHTRLWTLDPGSCTFHLDQFAHLVTDEDKHELKRTTWYIQMRKDYEDFFRELEESAKDPTDSNPMECVERIAMPYVNSSMVTSLPADVQISILIGDDGSAREIDYSGGTPLLEHELDKYFKNQSVYRKLCRGKTIAFMVRYIVEGNETVRPVSDVQFKPPSEFVVHSHPVIPALDPVRERRVE